MGTVASIQNGAAGANFKANKFSRGYWGEGSEELAGRYSCGGSQEYLTDTDPTDVSTLNIFVNSGTKFFVYEGQSEKLWNYEKFVVDILLSNFESGKGPENYIFPLNGKASSLFLNSDLLKSALSQYSSGILRDGVPKKVDFGFSDLLSDAFRNGSVFTIPGLVGSAQITIVKKPSGIYVQIFNIMSLSSGALIKDPYDKGTFPMSYQRDPSKITPFGNISTTFSLFLGFENTLIKKMGIKQ